MAKATTPAAPKALVKREPALVATGVATLLSTFLYVAPSIGIPIPDSVIKVASALFTVLAGFGIRSAVQPVAR